MTWNLPPLAPGASASVTFVAAVATDGTYSNAAHMRFSHMTVREILSGPAVTVRDTVPPSVAIVAGPTGVTNDNTPTFSFTTDPSAVTKLCAIDNVGFTPCAPDPALYTSAPLDDGPHTFVVRVTDAAGNTASASRAFEVDTTPPVVIIPGPPINPTVTSSSTPRFFFTVDDATETITFCSFAGEPFTQCASPVGTSGRPDGTYTFSVYGQDAAGNTGPIASFTFTIDSRAPIVSITMPLTPPDPSLFSTPTPSFVFRYVEDHPASIMCRVASEQNLDPPFTPCTSPFTTQPLPDGMYSLAIRVTDEGGLQGTATRNFRVDTIPPTVEIPGHPINPTATSDPTPTLRFTVGGDPADVRCRVVGAQNQSPPFEPCRESLEGWLLSSR